METWLSVVVTAAFALSLQACAKRAADRTESTSSTWQGEERRPQTVGSQPGSGAAAVVRMAQKAGTWYPNDRAWAAAEMRRMLRAASAAPRLPAKPVALVVPHAGWSYSGAAAAAAYSQLRRGDYDRVVLLGPSHYGNFEGYSLSDYDAYETPLGRIPVCRESRELRDGTLVRDVRDADRGEHSLEIQLPWLQETLGAFCLVPILVGHTDAESERALAAKLAAFENERTLFVVSSDFVHYGKRFDYTPFGDSPTEARDRVFALENQAIELLSNQDAAGLRRLVAATGATICGYRGMLVLLEMLKSTAPKPKALPLAHYSSADLPGERDDSGSVCYAALGYSNVAASRTRPLGAPRPAEPCSAHAEVSESLGQTLLGVARATLETELGGTDELDHALAELPKTARLDCRQAVFVTLKAHGELRGCVGQVEPEYPLFEAVVRSALDAALNDHRFSPVVATELEDLSFELTVLSVPTPVASSRDIVLGTHGIIMSSAGRRALFLPQVPAEQGWDLTETLRALSRKAGLDADAWSGPGTKFAVFTGAVFEERPGRRRSEGRSEGIEGGTER